MKAIFLALLLTAGPLSSAAMAQTVMQACGPDVQRLCGKVEPGNNRIKKCMKKHMREVSPTCLQTLLNAKESEMSQ
jgi:hypothetical protein